MILPQSKFSFSKFYFCSQTKIGVRSGSVTWAPAQYPKPNMHDTTNTREMGTPESRNLISVISCVFNICKYASFLWCKRTNIRNSVRRLRAKGSESLRTTLVQNCSDVSNECLCRQLHYTMQQTKETINATFSDGNYF